ncbi:hypothetical protein ACFL3E_01795 [Patescibacteria group bacterium]
MSFAEFIERITKITSSLIPLVLLIAGVVFISGIIKYIAAGGDEEKLKQAKNLIIYGLISISVIVMTWGVVRLLALTIFGSGGIEQGIPTELPEMFDF